MYCVLARVETRGGMSPADDGGRFVQAIEGNKQEGLRSVF